MEEIFGLLVTFQPLLHLGSEVWEVSINFLSFYYMLMNYPRGLRPLDKEGNAPYEIFVTPDQFLIRYLNFT